MNTFSTKNRFLQDAINHWYELADNEEYMITNNLTCGSAKVFHVRADMYRRTAKALEIQRDTGIAVCSCHHKPFGSLPPHSY